MSIDVHNHFYPPAYLDALRTGEYRAQLRDDEDSDDPTLAYSGDYNILVPGHRDLSARIEDMDEVGMQSHILTLTTPGVHIEKPERGVELARIVNEDFAEICRRHAGRFYAFCALPLQNPEAAAEELEYAVSNLGLHGAVLFTNINGKALDHPSFEPVFAAAEKLQAPLLIHPTSPDEQGILGDYRLVPLLGFLFDTTATIGRMVFGGIFERHPDLKLIAAHLGGTLPYVAERMDRGYRVYPEIQDLIPHPPSHYLARLYYDTVNFEPGALDYAAGWAGHDHLLVGSDYPHQIGDMRRALDAVKSMDLTQKQKEAVLRGNAQKILVNMGE